MGLGVGVLAGAVVGVVGVDAVLADADCPEVPFVGVDPDWEEVSESEEEPLPVVGVEAEELPLELESLELDPVLVPVDVPLALCAKAGSSGITIASVNMTKKTAQPVPARRKKFVRNPLPLARLENMRMYG